MVIDVDSITKELEEPLRGAKKDAASAPRNGAEEMYYGKVSGIEDCLRVVKSQIEVLVGA